MSNLGPILAALLPLFALIVAGAALQRLDFPGGDFWSRLERLIYYVLFPALLVEGLATADVAASQLPGMVAATTLTILAMSAALFALRPLLRVDGPGLTSVYQGAVRFNTYLGIAIALALYGEPVMAPAALVLALLIPLVNVGSVLMLTVYAGGATDAGALARGLARNPLILACLAGLALNLTGIGLNTHLASLLDIAGSAAVPLGLMTVGAGLRLSRVWRDAGTLVQTTVLKLALMPAVAWLAAGLFALDTMETRALVLIAALPTAPSAYILARQMGGDHRLVASILTLQTAAAAVTLPVVLSLLERA